MLAAALFHSQWQLLPGLCCHHSLQFSNLIAGQCHSSYQIHSYLYGNIPLIIRAAFVLFFYYLNQSGGLIALNAALCMWKYKGSRILISNACSSVDGRKKYWHKVRRRKQKKTKNKKCFHKENKSSLCQDIWSSYIHAQKTLCPWIHNRNILHKYFNLFPIMALQETELVCL